MLRIALPLVAALGVTLPAFAQQARTANSQQDARGGDWLDIELNKSIVVETPRTPRAISITNPEIADVVQLGSPTKWQIQGTSIGSTDLVIQFGSDEPPLIYEITVHQDLSDLIRRIETTTPPGTTAPRVYPLNGHIVVEGAVPDLDTLERITMVARMFDEEFVNLLRVGGDHQVQLEVVYAEVSRTGLRALGINLLWNLPQAGAAITNNLTALPGGWTSLQAPLGGFTLDGGGYSLSGFVGQGINLAGALTVLDNANLVKIMAQPTLVSLSGQKSEFLNGGKVPIVIPNPQGIPQFRFEEYGTRMLFIPTVLANDVIDIQVDVELSQVDDSTSVQVLGTSVPGLTARRVKAHVRVKDGMTFAIAGLLSENVSYARIAVPGLGRIPVLGALFRRVEHLREEREVMVYVTPRLVRPLAENDLPPILGTTEDNNPSDLALFLLGTDRRAGSRVAAPTGVIGLHR